MATRSLTIIKIEVRILIEVEEILCSWASDRPMLRATILGEDKPGLASRKALISHEFCQISVPLNSEVAKSTLLSSSVRHNW